MRVGIMKRGLMVCSLLSALSLCPVASAASGDILSLRTVSGVVGSDFVGSAYRAGLTPDNIRKVISVMDSQIDMGKLKPSDKFSVLLAEEAGKRGAFQVYAAKILGGNRSAVVVKYVRDGQFYDLYGRSATGATVPYFVLPIRTGRPSSLFNTTRMHPILKKVRPHYGIDIAAPMGTPVYAPATGIISKSDASKGSGNRIYLMHKEGLETRYLHLSKSLVRRGDVVRRGDLIGYVGTTGYSTGPHLHWEVRVRGTPVDPVKALALSYNEIPQQEKGLFAQSAKVMLTKMETDRG